MRETQNEKAIKIRVTSIAGNATIGSATYLAESMVAEADLNLSGLLWSAGAGALAGAIGGKGMNAAKLKGVISTSRMYLKTAVSSKKIAMYTGKIAACKRAAITSSLRYAFAAGFSTISSSARNTVIR